MTIKEIYKKAVGELKIALVDEPEASAQFLLRHVLGMSKTEFFANLEQEISSKEEKKFMRLLKRRKKHEPVWQILGKVEFWGLDFAVNQNVLIPRPETEFLVQEALKRIRDHESGIVNVLDVGTGAGTIAIAIASESGIKNHELRVFASDVSGKALSVAKKNAKALKVEKSIKFIKSDLFKNIEGKFDIITANLPYIPTEDLGGLALEIHHYEPRLALDGGNGGLVLYEKFLKAVPTHLNEKGSVFCEIGKGQGESFCKFVKKYLPKAKCEIKKDLAGFDRIAIISL